MKNIEGYQPTDKLDTSTPPTDKLVLFDVIQRSELLIDFLTWYAQKIDDNFTEQFNEQLVKDYLKSINCV